MQLRKIEKPFNLIIFGASGDLAKLKLFPSIYELALQKRLPQEYSIYGFARSKISTAEFRKVFAESVRTHTNPDIFDEKALDNLLKHVHYHQGQYDKPAAYKAFAQKLLKAHDGKKVYNLAFFSTPSVVFKEIVANLANIRKIIGQDLELMIEKPFGENRESAGELFQFISNFFEKRNLFLIDHYLGKATVKSIFPLRYNNTVLNLLLKGSAISNIQITAFEMAGVDERINFFEDVGIIKDMIQSHLLQILALFTMSMPLRRDVKSIRREKGNILSALRYPEESCNIVVGQYENYRDQKGVKKDSKTPTFAAIRCMIDLTRWYGVPIYIRTGKRMSHKHTYIAVEFKAPPYTEKHIQPNRLVVELHPNEKMELHMVNDKGEKIGQQSNFISSESLACEGDDCLPAYAGLILDAFTRRYESFLSIDEILASWHFIDSISKCMEKEGIVPIAYKNGTDGPKEQEKLTAIDNFKWYDAHDL